RRDAEKIHKDPLAQQHVLVDEHSHCVTLVESTQNAACKITFFDSLAAAQAPIAIDEFIHQGIVKGAHNEVAGVAVYPVSERAKFPVAEMGGEKKNAATLALGLGVILKSIIDYQVLNIAAVPMRKMREVCQHPAKVAKQAGKHFPALALRPIRESQLQVEQTHTAQAGPEPVTQERQNCAERPRQTVRQRPKQLQQDKSSIVFHPIS